MPGMWSVHPCICTWYYSPMSMLQAESRLKVRPYGYQGGSARPGGKHGSNRRNPVSRGQHAPLPLLERYHQTPWLSADVIRSRMTWVGADWGRSRVGCHVGGGAWPVYRMARVTNKKQTGKMMNIMSLPGCAMRDIRTALFNCSHLEKDDPSTIYPKNTK